MRALIVVIAIAVVPTSSVFADSTEDAALVHLDRGIAAFNAKDFPRALRELTAAHELVPDKANPYRWLALTEIQLGDCASALGHIDGFLARVPASDPRVAEMTRWREFCRRPAPQQPASPPPPAERKSLTQRWWFWPAVGSAALAITGGAIWLATDRDDTVLPPIHCDAMGCK